MLRVIFLVVFVLFIPVRSLSQDFSEGELQTFFEEISGNKVRIGVQNPHGAPAVGEVLFLTGFADRLDNHPDLFAELNRQGFRVVSFDYPSHGETEQTLRFSGLNFQNFRSIARIGKQALEKAYATFPPETPLPLCLAGWSTGGLILTRWLQSKTFPDLGRPIRAAFVITPGVSPKLLVGTLGVVTKGTLTQNSVAPYQGKLKPRSPFLKPFFSASLIFNALLSWFQRIPNDVPYLMFVAGQKDAYTNSDEIVKWGKRQRDRFGANLQIVRFEEGYHDLANEPEPIGRMLRINGANFLRVNLPHRRASRCAVF